MFLNYTINLKFSQTQSITANLARPGCTSMLKHYLMQETRTH